MCRQLSWDDVKNIKSDKLSMFKGEKDKVKVIHFMEAPFYDAVHYSKAAGTYWSARSKWRYEKGQLLIDEYGWDAKASESVPTIRFCAPILVYETNADGEFLTEDPEKIRFDFQLWTFAPRTGEQVRMLTTKFKITEVDAYVTCEDENFQRVILQANPDGMMKNEVFRKRVEEAYAVWPHRKVKNVVNPITDEELAKKLGVPLERTQETADPNDELDQK